MAKAKTEMIRKRLNVPKDAMDILEWMDQQTDVSVSVRLLIRDFLDDHGCVDRVGVSLAHDTDRVAVRKRKSMAFVDMSNKGRVDDGIGPALRKSSFPRKEQSVVEPKEEVVVPKSVHKDIPLVLSAPAYQVSTKEDEIQGFDSEREFDMADILGTL